MTLDEALSQAVEGARVTAEHMQPGCYVEHSFSRGFLRCWRVDAPDEEPNRTQCDFIAGPLDREAEWRILEREEQYPPKPKLTGGWGALRSGDKLTTKSGIPVADVIDLSADYAALPGAYVELAKPTPWAKPLDPRKGGW